MRGGHERCDVFPQLYPNGSPGAAASAPTATSYGAIRLDAQKPVLVGAQRGADRPCYRPDRGRCHPALQFRDRQCGIGRRQRQACTTAAAGAHVGACWPFVTNRFWNFIYSTYPEAERWRVNLCFLLEIATFVWLLVPRIGGKGWALLNLLVVFPLLSFWLLTGGLGLTPVGKRRGGAGFLLTIVVATVGITASLPLGVLFALGRRSTMPVARYLSIAFIRYFRGIPLIVVLFSRQHHPALLPSGRAGIQIRCCAP